MIDKVATKFKQYLKSLVLTSDLSGLSMVLGILYMYHPTPILSFLLAVYTVYRSTLYTLATGETPVGLNCKGEMRIISIVIASFVNVLYFRDLVWRLEAVNNLFELHNYQLLLSILINIFESLQPS